MDCNKHQENNESSKISGKRAKVKDLEIQKYDEKSHVFPDYSVEGVPLTLGN